MAPRRSKQMAVLAAVVTAFATSSLLAACWPHFGEGDSAADSATECKEITDPAVTEKALAIVEDYVRETHQWDRDVYCIEFFRRDGDILEFWIIHDDDERPSHTLGGGKSISVEVNEAAGEVVREYGFQ